MNLDRPERWSADTAASVTMYNRWFREKAPEIFHRERVKAAKKVEEVFAATRDLSDLSPRVLLAHPSVLPVLRMATCPPLARDRLIGLAQVGKGLVDAMEDGRLPGRMSQAALQSQIQGVCQVLQEMLDTDLFPVTAWTEEQAARSAWVLADRVCAAQAETILRNAQEERQLAAITGWLTARGYRQAPPHPADRHPGTMPAGTFALRMKIRARADEEVDIPVDVVVQPHRPGPLPLMIEAKSAGDATNTNKRRKEEADKMRNLRERFGAGVPYVLFLCGYFESTYLQYEAAEGIDWVWEHRIDDLSGFGL